MNLLQRMTSGWVPMDQLSNIDAMLPFMTAPGGGMYPFGGMQTISGDREEIVANFVGLVQGAYRRNGVVFAVALARQMLFAQARFQYQHMRAGRPGDLWGDATLAPLEHPWDGGTTGDLLTRMLQDNDGAGDAFVVRRGDRLRRARPDWVTLVLGSFDDPEVEGGDIDADVLGLLYHPGGIGSGRQPQVFLGKHDGRPSEFAHFALIPDPLGFRRGISWMSAVVPNVQAHSAATAHKLKFFENGATVNMVVSNVPGATTAQFDEWVKRFDTSHRGLARAYKTLYLSGATTATPVGSNFQQMDFRQTQGMDEVAICNAGGVPAAVVGISDGLAGSALNEGNYTAAMRRFADLFARPAWQNVASSLESIIPPPGGSRLYYDDRDIPALKDDIKDAADVRSLQAQAIRQLVDAGFEPASVVDAINAGDLKRLQHTGLYSVQLQPPMPEGKPEPAEPMMKPDQSPAEEAAPKGDVPNG